MAFGAVLFGVYGFEVFDLYDHLATLLGGALCHNESVEGFALGLLDQHCATAAIGQLYSRGVVAVVDGQCDGVGHSAIPREGYILSLGGTLAVCGKVDFLAHCPMFEFSEFFGKNSRLCQNSKLRTNQLWTDILSLREPF